MGDVANALGGQRVAGVAPFSSSLDKAPGVHEALHHLADPALRDAEPEGKVLTRDHWVVGYEVERPLLSRADAEGRAATPASAPATECEALRRGCLGISRDPGCDTCSRTAP